MYSLLLVTEEMEGYKRLAMDKLSYSPTYTYSSFCLWPTRLG
jgi:hypothetical protein